MTPIWLLPEGRQEQRLQELINRLAEEHATVAFAPHLTVCGVPGDLAVLDDAAGLIAVIPAAIVLIVAVSMGIGAALLGYPVWAIPLIAVFGAGGAIVAIRVLG